MVTAPCVKGLSEAFTRIPRACRICTVVKPHAALWNMLVHPKDQTGDEEKPEVINKILSKNCDHVYIGTRVKEHQKSI